MALCLRWCEIKTENQTYKEKRCETIVFVQRTVYNNLKEPIALQTFNRIYRKKNCTGIRDVCDIIMNYKERCTR